MNCLNHALYDTVAGLQHAVETGRPEDTNPGYICTLCNVAVDANNFHLHFTSSAHRVNVLVSVNWDIIRVMIV